MSKDAGFGVREKKARVELDGKSREKQVPKVCEQIMIYIPGAKAGKDLPCGPPPRATAPAFGSDGKRYRKEKKKKKKKTKIKKKKKNQKIK